MPAGKRDTTFKLNKFKMKKILFTVFAMLLMVVFCNAQSSEIEDYKALIKERKEMAKLTRDLRNEKSSKDAKKAAKEMEKEGWKPAPGSLPLDKLNEKVWEMQYELDPQTGFPKYIIASGSGVAETYDVAKTHAMARAKTSLAGQIATELADILEDKVANKAISEKDATSLAEIAEGGVQKIQQKLGRILTIMEVYKDHKKTKEVRVTISYNFEMAKTAAMDALREDMESRSDELVGKAREALGL